MPLSLDQALGIHAQALTLQARRAEMLSSNLANADTPNYKARDIDFRAALGVAQAQQAVTLKVTHPAHVQAAAEMGPATALYRVPTQASLDGNTVDRQLEQTAFAQNAVQYQASLAFLSGKLKTLLTALRGE